MILYFFTWNISFTLDIVFNKSKSSRVQKCSIYWVCYSHRKHDGEERDVSGIWHFCQRGVTSQAFLLSVLLTPSSLYSDFFLKSIAVPKQSQTYTDVLSQHECNLFLKMVSCWFWTMGSKYLHVLSPAKSVRGTRLTTISSVSYSRE